MTTFHHIVLLLSVVLLAGLIVMEARRVNRARLVWRIVADVGLVGGLACLAIPVSYMRKKMDVGILLTEGYHPDSVTAAMKRYAVDGAHVFTHAGEVTGGSLLHVFGYGLTEEECKMLEGVRVEPHLPPDATGIAEVSWKHLVRPGEQLNVRGRYHYPGDGPVMVKLMGMGDVLDSQVVGAGGRFRLRTTPAQIGRAVYRLVAIKGVSDTLEQEPVPFEVAAGPGLHVLMLAGAPDPEIRALADWLAGQGNGVMVRTAISRDRYDHSWLNMPQHDPDPISGVLLDKFDVVLADDSVLQRMSPQDHDLVYQHVREKGMGLVLRVDSGVAVREKRRIYGSGKIYTGMLTGSFAKLLAGDQAGYGEGWTEVLQAVARREPVAEEWRVWPELARVNDRVRLELRSMKDQLPEVVVEEEGVDAVTAYMAQDPWLSFMWTASYWPRKEGWHTIAGSSFSWWVYGSEDWQPLHRQERLETTRRWTAAHETRADMIANENAYPVPVSKLWFAAIFLLCCVFLWAERKI